MRKTTVLLAAIALMASAIAYAGQNDAGCGVGSLLFKENQPVQQILAATTNGTFGNQTFAITTGTAGCTSGGVVKTAQAPATFIETNYRNLARDTSAGQGEYAESFASLLGCKKESVPSFLTFGKTNYSKLFPTETAPADQVLNNFKTQIAADPVLSKSCTL